MVQEGYLPRLDSNWSSADYGTRAKQHYHASFDYFIGGLGQDEDAALRERTELQGTLSMQLVKPEKLTMSEIELVEKTAKFLYEKVDTVGFLYFSFIAKAKKEVRFLFTDSKTNTPVPFKSIKLETPQFNITATVDENSYHTYMHTDRDLKANEKKKYFDFVTHCIDRKVDYVAVRNKSYFEASVPKKRELESKSESKRVISDKEPVRERVAIDVNAVVQRSSGDSTLGLVEKRNGNNIIVLFAGKKQNLTYTRTELSVFSVVLAKPPEYFNIPLFTKVKLHSLINKAELNGTIGLFIYSENEKLDILINDTIKRLALKNVSPLVPIGWVCHFDHESYLHYYVHTSSEHTQWEYPKDSF